MPETLPAPIELKTRPKHRPHPPSTPRPRPHLLPPPIDHYRPPYSPQSPPPIDYATVTEFVPADRSEVQRAPQPQYSFGANELAPTPSHYPRLDETPRVIQSTGGAGDYSPPPSPTLQHFPAQQQQQPPNNLYQPQQPYQQQYQQEQPYQQQEAPTFGDLMQAFPQPPTGSFIHQQDLPPADPYAHQYAVAPQPLQQLPFNPVVVEQQHQQYPRIESDFLDQQVAAENETTDDEALSEEPTVDGNESYTAPSLSDSAPLSSEPSSSSSEDVEQPADRDVLENPQRVDDMIGGVETVVQGTAGELHSTSSNAQLALGQDVLNALLTPVADPSMGEWNAARPSAPPPPPMSLGDASVSSYGQQPQQFPYYNQWAPQQQQLPPPQQQPYHQTINTLYTPEYYNRQGDQFPIHNTYLNAPESSEQSSEEPTAGSGTLSSEQQPNSDMLQGMLDAYYAQQQQQQQQQPQQFYPHQPYGQPMYNAQQQQPDQFAYPQQFAEAPQQQQQFVGGFRLPSGGAQSPEQQQVHAHEGHHMPQFYAPPNNNAYAGGFVAPIYEAKNTTSDTTTNNDQPLATYAMQPQGYPNPFAFQQEMMRGAGPFDGGVAGPFGGGGPPSGPPGPPPMFGWPGAQYGPGPGGNEFGAGGELVGPSSPPQASGVANGDALSSSESDDAGLARAKRRLFNADESNPDVYVLKPSNS